MKTVRFILSVDFEPPPNADEIEAVADQLREILEDAVIDFCGNLEIGELTLMKPDRRKGRKVRGSYDRKA